VFTLGKQITVTFFEQPDGFDKLEAHWRRAWQDEEWRNSLTAAHFLIYMAIRGKDWIKIFTPVLNEVKLANGMRPLEAVDRALAQIARPRADLLTPFGGCVTPEGLRRLYVTLQTDTEELDLGTAAFVWEPEEHVAA